TWEILLGAEDEGQEPVERPSRAPGRRRGGRPEVFQPVGPGHAAGRLRPRAMRPGADAGLGPGHARRADGRDPAGGLRLRGLREAGHAGRAGLALLPAAELLP